MSAGSPLAPFQTSQPFYLLYLQGMPGQKYVRQSSRQTVQSQYNAIVLYLQVHVHLFLVCVCLVIAEAMVDGVLLADARCMSNS